MAHNTSMKGRAVRTAALSAVGAMALSGCGFSPYDLPLPGGADTGDHPYQVTAEFRDVLDLVPQSGVRVNDLAVGKVTDIELKGWTAKVTLEINGDVDLPDNAVATIRQTSLLGEKFVSLAPPESGATGKLSDGDNIALDQTGRNPEIEEVFSAASLLFNGGGLERTNTIMKELNLALGGNEPEVKELLGTTEAFLGQLDDNKQALITSLEKVNNLAIQTDKQKAAITGALDSLPEALDVVNGQRDDLVKLLTSLSDLGDVATGVIKESKADTIANLQALTPILGNLAEASDALAYDFKALLTFPFTDGMVGGTFARASGDCTHPVGSPQNTGWCVGDFHNLSIHLNLGGEQLLGLGIDDDDLTGIIDDVLDGLLGGGDADGAGAAAQSPTEGAVGDLQKALSGLTSGGTTSPDGTGSDTAPKKSGGLCLPILQSCRVAPASVAGGYDLTTVMLDPMLSDGGESR